MARKNDTDRDHILVNIDPEDLKDAAAHAVGALADAGKSVADGATSRVQAAKDWAEPLVSNVHEWIKPRVDKAWSDSVVAAAPHVERLATKAGPALQDAHDKLAPAAAAAGAKASEGITSAHGKLVEEFLPRIVHLVNEAAERKIAGSEHRHEARAVENAAEALALHEVRKHHPHREYNEDGHNERHHRHGDHFHDRHHHPVAVVVADAVAEPVKEHHHHRKLLALALLAAGAAGYHYWRRAQPQHDPWAEPFDEVGDEHANYYGAAGDAAEKIGAAAGTAVAYGREAGEKIGEWTREGVSRVRNRHASRTETEDFDDVRDTFLDGPEDEEFVILVDGVEKPRRVSHIVDEARAKVGPETHKLVEEAKAIAEKEAPKIGDYLKAEAEKAGHKLVEEAKEHGPDIKAKAEAEAKKLLEEAKTKGAAEGRRLVAAATRKAEAEVRHLVAEGKAAHAKHEAEKKAEQDTVELVDVVEVEPVAVEVEPVAVVTEEVDPVVKVREI